MNHPLASLIGDRRHDSSDATATAVWGGPVAGTTIPLAISECEFATRAAGAKRTQPRGAILLRHGDNADTGLWTATQAGSDGWTTVDCDVQRDAAVSGSARRIAGHGRQPNTTKNRMRRGRTSPDCSGRRCSVPLYRGSDLTSACSTGTGKNGEYIINRFAAFKVTAFKTTVKSRRRRIRLTVAMYEPNESLPIRGIEWQPVPRHPWRTS